MGSATSDELAEEIDDCIRSVAQSSDGAEVRVTISPHTTRPSMAFYSRHPDADTPTLRRWSFIEKYGYERAKAMYEAMGEAIETYEKIHDDN